MEPSKDHPAKPTARQVRAASFDAETLTALDQPKHKASDPPPPSPKVDHALDADATLIASHNSALSAAIRAAPVHDLLDPRRLKKLCEEVAKSEAAGAAGAAGATGGAAGATGGASAAGAADA